MRMSFAVLALVFALAGARAQTSSAPAPPSPPSAEASIHGYGDHDKTCIAWTDQCRTCARGANDEVTCSNIGIACQPAAIACTARQSPKQPESKQPEPKQPEPKQPGPAK